MSNDPSDPYRSPQADSRLEEKLRLPSSDSIKKHYVVINDAGNARLYITAERHYLNKLRKQEWWKLSRSQRKESHHMDAKSVLQPGMRGKIVHPTEMDEASYDLVALEKVAKKSNFTHDHLPDATSTARAIMDIEKQRKELEGQIFGSLNPPDNILILERRLSDLLVDEKTSDDFSSNKFISLRRLSKFSILPQNAVLLYKLAEHMGEHASEVRLRIISNTKRYSFECSPLAIDLENNASSAAKQKFQELMKSAIGELDADNSDIPMTMTFTEVAHAFSADNSIKLARAVPIVDPEVQKRDIQEAPIMSFLSDVQFDENKVTIMFNGETYHRKMEQRHIDGIKTLKELMGEYQNTAMLVFEKTPENKVRPTVFRIIPRAVEAHPNSEHILKLQKALGQPKAQYYKFDKAVENATNILENGLDFGDSGEKSR